MFKRAQVLRTQSVIRTIVGDSLPENTRVVVLRQVKDKPDQWKVKVQDPALPAMRGLKAIVSTSKLGLTFRGRPTKPAEVETV